MAVVAVGAVAVASKVAAMIVLLMRSVKLTPHSELLPFQLVRVFWRHHQSLQIKAAEARQQPVVAMNAVAGMAPDLAKAHARPVMEAKPER